MKDLGKRNVLGVLVDCVDYEGAATRILDAARAKTPLSVSALAVHGVMTGVQDEQHRYRLNHLDLVTPDGQPVRWALNLLHSEALRDRVYGPVLMLRVCEAAAGEGLPIFLYGSDRRTLDSLVERLQGRFPNLRIAGVEASKFRRTTEAEKEEIAARIRASGARITFVGLGCPRQEVFAYEYRDHVSMPVIAVGAAFDYHSGNVRQPSVRIQAVGLQWAYRLLQEPGRLWKRYLLLNPAYVGLLLAQWTKLWKPEVDGVRPPTRQLLYG
jgi:N-acetylglucosaminyldiphosphoundecaprenol N-acetyl-beta-D-mannosaminyltransferase